MSESLVAIVDEEESEFPEGSSLWQDTGFQGFAPEGIRIRQPKKKPKNQSLSESEKAENQAISRERVEIEHQIGGINCKGNPRSISSDSSISD